MSLTASAASCIQGDDPGTATSALTGAVFTTLVDGARVNANIYENKEDVYLDGGPGQGPGPGAAALPEGDYYFQVTDPSGKVLLSEDAIECRRFHVSSDGVVDAIYADSGCAHATGVDQDHDELGAITVQLMPYADTPNPGGEYKMWVTRVENYDIDRGKHGFVNRHSKTDNFKVRNTTEPPAPYCGDGTMDEGEECDDGNDVAGDGCTDCTIDEPPPQPYCGDGTMDEGEECDDGNDVDGDGCTDCTIDVEPPKVCCGDGEMNSPDEECDDGNTADGDGCSSTCKIETPPPPPKEPCCGDGEMNVEGEECDDGNTADGDGCSSSCKLEQVG